MNDRPPTDLDAFEAALLTELQALTVQPAAAAGPGRQAPARLPRRRHGRRWQLLVAAAAASAVGVALLVPNLGPTPAYAVTGRNDEQVKVKVNRLEGAESLEQALRERGIAADITYLPAEKDCAPGRYAEIRTPGLLLSVSAEQFEVTIPRTPWARTTPSSCLPP